MEFIKPREYKSISSSEIKEKEDCGKTCTDTICFCGKI